MQSAHIVFVQSWGLGALRLVQSRETSKEAQGRQCDVNGDRKLLLSVWAGASLRTPAARAHTRTQHAVLAHNLAITYTFVSQARRHRQFNVNSLAQLTSERKTRYEIRCLVVKKFKKICYNFLFFNYSCLKYYTISINRHTHLFWLWISEFGGAEVKT